MYYKNNVKALKEFLDGGGNPNHARKDWPHETLLMDAVMESNIEIVALLIDKINEKGLDPNVPCSNRTPLDIAVYKDENPHRLRAPDALNQDYHAANTIILTMLKQAKELYLIRRMQARRRGKSSRLESKTLGYIRESQKEDAWIELKRQMQANGFKPAEIEQFYNDHYKKGSKKKKKKKTKKKPKK